MNTNELQWQNINTEDKGWIHDKLHSTKPFSPAAQVLQGAYLEKGFNRAFIEYGLPYRVDVRFFNEYYYINIPPFQRRNIAQEILEKHLEIYDACVKNYPQTWMENFLPKINKHSKAFASYSMKNDLLISDFIDFLKRAEDLWYIHGLNFLPMFIAPSQFIRKCEESGIADTHLIFDSLNSLSNQTIDMGKSLFQIVSAIQNDAKILAIFSNDDDKSIFAQILKEDKEGKLTDLFKDFMKKFGLRNDFCLEISQPAWHENPHKIISLIRPQLQQDANNFDIKQQELKERKANAYMTIKKHIKDNEFDQWYHAACLAVKVQEDHNYYIEQRVIEQSRRFYLRFAEIFLDKNYIQNAQDIFMLKPDEIIDLCNQKTLDPQELILQRKFRYEQAVTLQAPEMLGKINSHNIEMTPLNLSIVDFFGGRLPQENVDHTLKGHGVGKKKISAFARVLSSLEEASLLQKGEILIVASPSPAWTTLFIIASALVTEQGGRLCHTAIVAREYDIPAIVGVPNATTLIQTGDWVTIDPTQGTINYKKNLS